MVLLGLVTTQCHDRKNCNEIEIFEINLFNSTRISRTERALMIIYSFLRKVDWKMMQFQVILVIYYSYLDKIKLY